MKQIKKRISLMLAVCMIISMLTTTVYAETWKSEDTVTQTVEPHIMSAPTTGAAISVGIQEGVLFAGVESGEDGQFSNVEYKLKATNIEQGVYDATVDVLPAGVSVKDGKVKIDAKGEGILELAGNTDTVKGRTKNLTLTIKGGSLPADGVTSGPFELTIIDIEFMEITMGLVVKSMEVNIPSAIISFLGDKENAYADGKGQIDLKNAIEDEVEAFGEISYKFKDYSEDNEYILNLYLEDPDALIAEIDELLEEYKAVSDALAEAAKPFFKDEAWEYARLKYEAGLLSIYRMQLGLLIGKINKEQFNEIYVKLESEITKIIPKYFDSIEGDIKEIEDAAIKKGDWGALAAFWSEVYDFVYGLLEEYGIVGGTTKEYYGLTVGGVMVTSENCGNITGDGIDGSVSYDEASKTLTLNNAKIAVNSGDFFYTAIKVSDKIDNLKIVLQGSSQIGNKFGEDDSIDYTVYEGINSNKKITVEGRGSLTVYDMYIGIKAKDITVDTTGTITITEYGGGKACCLKADGGTLEIKNGTLNLSSLVSNGLYGDKIIISGGTITAESFDEDGLDYYAFNKAPTFASGYKHKVYAGEDKASAEEVTSPTPETFTESKYVKIVPVTSGGGSDKDDDKGGSKDKDTSTPSVPTPPAPPTKTDDNSVEKVLKDVGAHWALNSIQFVYDRGIMTGTSAELFSPDAHMDRGMLITALGRLADINVLDFTSSSFDDVDMASYYRPYAEWSLISNIARGTGNNNFSPDKPVTREELAVILVNFARAMGYALPSGEGAGAFADDSSISPWAMEAIEIMRNANIMQGDPSNRFNPKSPATRAETAAVLQRFIKLMGI